MEINVSHQIDDSRWDTFLQETPRSHYLQSSLWAQVNHQRGWRCVRVTIETDNQIIAGFQMLLRSVPLVGKIGFIPRGPVIINDDTRLIEAVLQQIYQVARTEKVILFKLQPPHTDEVWVERLIQEEFWPSHSHADNVATVLIDLALDESQLLKNMKKSLRKGIRRAERAGVTVRKGTAQDLSTFYRILQETSWRGNFAIHNEAYYQQVWQIFVTSGHIALFLAEYEGEAVAGVMLILFGDTAYARFGGWNGRHGKYEPNSFLRWTAIRWAKTQGYRWYDFMGIDETVARAVLRGQKPHGHGYSAFKLGFGGQVVLSPGTYDYMRQPFLFKSYKWLAARPALYDPLLDLIRNVRKSDE